MQRAVADYVGDASNTFPKASAKLQPFSRISKFLMIIFASFLFKTLVKALNRLHYPLTCCFLRLHHEA